VENDFRDNEEAPFCQIGKCRTAQKTEKKERKNEDSLGAYLRDLKRIEPLLN